MGINAAGGVEEEERALRRLVTVFASVVLPSALLALNFTLGFGMRGRTTRTWNAGYGY